MSISDGISAIALVLALLAIYQTYQATRSQNRLTEREIELVRIQIQQARESAKRESTASVSARSHKLDKTTWRLRVFNSGPADAQNVRLVFDDQNSLIDSSAANRKFPMAKMEKGQSVDVNMYVHMQSNSKEWLTIRWDDQSQVDNENRIEITI